MNGLFGTHASILTDIGLILVELSMVFALIARYHIGQKHLTKHRNNMLIGSALLYLFLTFYVLNYVLNGVKTFGGTGISQFIYYLFLIIHIFGAMGLGIFCTMLVYRSIKRTDKSQENDWKKFNFEKDYRSLHKKIGRINVYLWVFTALSGFMVYIMLYVLYEPIHVI